MSNPTNLFKMPIVGGRVAKQPSYNEILPRLYLGDICVARNKDELTNLGITDMISVEIKPLQASELAPSIKRYLFINVMDHSKMDIISHFDSSNEFIETALKNPSNRIYVHCVAGISRSATLVIAYIMKTRSMDYLEAFELVSQKRKVIDPNEGFVKQLALYHKMKYVIDIGNLDYRKIVLDALVFEFRLIFLTYYQTQTSKSSIFPGLGGSNHHSGGTIVQVPIHGVNKNLANKNSVNVMFDQYYNKLNLQQVSKFPQVYDPNTAFRCNKCRVIVFYAISVIENKINEQEAANIYPSNAASSTSKSALQLAFKANKDVPIKCQFIFIEPQPWMSKNILESDGNLECYKCKRKLGKFDWTNNESCFCPKHIMNLNLIFKIMKKKVDPGNSVSPKI